MDKFDTVTIGGEVHHAHEAGGELIVPHGNDAVDLQSTECAVRDVGWDRGGCQNAFRSPRCRYLRWSPASCGERRHRRSPGSYEYRCGDHWQSGDTIQPRSVAATPTQIAVEVAIRHIDLAWRQLILGSVCEQEIGHLAKTEPGAQPQRARGAGNFPKQPGVRLRAAAVLCV